MPARLLLPLLALFFCARSARAAEPRFGDPGEVVPLGSFSVSYTHFYAAGTNPSSSELELDGLPGLLYFASRNFAIGVELDLNVQSLSAPPAGSAAMVVTEHAYGVLVDFAYNLWLDNRVSLFPQFALGPVNVDATYSNGGEVQSHLVRADVQLDLLYHPAPHFFIGAGPSLILRFYSSEEYENRYTLAFGTVIGGWF